MFKPAGPCPYCLTSDPAVGREARQVFVRCQQCGARGPAILLPRGDAQELAVYSWNLLALKKPV
jgi:hypothetical protein